MLAPVHRCARTFGDAVDEPMYFVLADFGKLGLAFVERDPVHCTWQHTVQQLAAGEWADVRQVVEVDMQRGTSKDVTDRARLAVEMVREGMPLDVVCAA